MANDTRPQRGSAQTIITAAARSDLERAGLDRIPRGLIRVKGVPILIRAVRSYVLDLSESVVAINREEELEFGISQVLQRLPVLPRVVAVPSDAQGALASALFAAGSLNPELPLVIAAGDSEIEGGIERHVRAFLAGADDASTIVFRSQEPRWSYLATTSGGAVSHVAEKRVVGSFATTGVFMFRRAQHFLDAAAWCFTVNARVNNRFYVSTTLNHLIYRGLTVGYQEIHQSSYHPWALATDLP